MLPCFRVSSTVRRKIPSWPWHISWAALGAVRMLQGNPTRPATDFASHQAVAANPQIFYKPDGTNRTVGEVRAIFDQRFGSGVPGVAPVTEATRWTLDVERLKSEMGTAWYDAHTKGSLTTTVRVSARTGTRKAA